MNGVLLVLILGVFFFRCIEKKNERKILGIQNTDGIRGLFAIAIIIHHVSQVFDSNNANYIISFFFFSYVGIFYMISGYGLTYSIHYKNNYLDNFISKRMIKMLPVWGIVLVSEYIWSILYPVNNGSMTLYTAFLRSGWFIKSIMWIYMIWYSVQRLCKKYNIWFRILLLISFSFYIIVCILFNKESFWYTDIFSFLLGIWLYYYKSKVVSTNKRKDVAYVIICAIILLICWLYVFVISQSVYIPMAGSIALIVGGISLSFLWCMFTKYFQIKKSIWNRIGKYSLEIYLFGETGGIAFGLLKYFRISGIICYPLCLIMILFETSIYVLFCKAINKVKETIPIRK